MSRYLIHPLVSIFCLLCASAVGAQAGPPVDGGPAEAAPSKVAPEPRSFGTTSETAHVLQAYAFEPLTSQNDGNFDADSVGSRYCTADCNLAAPLMLPAGSAIEAIELEGCDESDTGGVDAQIFRIDAFDEEVELIRGVFTGINSTPGCGFFMEEPDSVPTVDNLNNTYVIKVALPTPSVEHRFQAVRVYYRRQISPGPGIATFNDVSTGHPFFAAVEALAASGITGGCGGGDFCPNQSVTRGQMAVFLARALGLHWAP